MTRKGRRDGTKAYWQYLLGRYPQVAADGRLNFYLRRNEVGHLALSLPDMPEVDLLELAEEYGSVQLNILPILRKVVGDRQTMCLRVAREVGYSGRLLGNAYASKAKDNFPVIREVLALGDHYEISSPTGVVAAFHLWREGLLTTGQFVICNGYITGSYAPVIQAIRRGGLETVIPVLDKPWLLKPFVSDPGPEKYLLGARQKIRHGVRSLEEADQNETRFGMRFAEILRLADEIAATRNTELALYHIHLGSQITDEEEFLLGLLVGAEGYCRLRQRCDTLHIFDTGGGAPVAYSLAGPPLNLERLWRSFLTALKEMCRWYDVPEPDLLTEWGRHTVADYEMHIWPVIAAYDHRYQIGGSIMATLPDHWGIRQQFLVLPVNGFDLPCGLFTLVGLTCDEDDEYRDPALGEEGLIPLPQIAIAEEQPFFVAFCVTGAYQENLGPLGHCMQLEEAEVTLDFVDGEWCSKITRPPESRVDMLRHMEFEV